MLNIIFSNCTVCTVQLYMLLKYTINVDKRHDANRSMLTAATEYVERVAEHWLGVTALIIVKNNLFIYLFIYKVWRDLNISVNVQCSCAVQPL